MQIEMLRDSVIGVGEIERPPQSANMGDAVQTGMVKKMKVAKAGAVVNVTEDKANRLIQLGSARLPQPQQHKKAA